MKNTKMMLMAMAMMMTLGVYAADDSTTMLTEHIRVQAELRAAEAAKQVAEQEAIKLSEKLVQSQGVVTDLTVQVAQQSKQLAVATDALNKAQAVADLVEQSGNDALQETATALAQARVQIKGTQAFAQASAEAARQLAEQDAKLCAQKLAATTDALHRAQTIAHLVEQSGDDALHTTAIALNESLERIENTEAFAHSLTQPVTVGQKIGARVDSAIDTTTAMYNKASNGVAAAAGFATDKFVQGRDAALATSLGCKFMELEVAQNHPNAAVATVGAVGTAAALGALWAAGQLAKAGYNKYQGASDINKNRVQKGVIFVSGTASVAWLIHLARTGIITPQGALAVIKIAGNYALTGVKNHKAATVGAVVGAVALGAAYRYNVGNYVYSCLNPKQAVLNKHLADGNIVKNGQNDYSLVTVGKTYTLEQLLELQQADPTIVGLAQALNSVSV